MGIFLGGEISPHVSDKPWIHPNLLVIHVSDKPCTMDIQVVIQAASGFWCQLHRFRQVIFAALASAGAPADAWEPKKPLGMASGDLGPSDPGCQSRGFSVRDFRAPGVALASWLRGFDPDDYYTEIPLFLKLNTGGSKNICNITTLLGMQTPPRGSKM